MILSIAARPANDAIRLNLAGDLDISTVAMLSRATADALDTGTGCIIVDLADATFCDCAGFTGLLTCRHVALTHGVAFQVINPTGSPLRVMRLLNLYDLLTTRAQATGDLSAGSGGIVGSSMLPARRRSEFRA